MNLRRIFLNSQSLIFMGSQVAVGGINYLFQVYAARTLPVVEFGLWSQWLAQFSVACFVAAWLQSLTTIHPMESRLNLHLSRWGAVTLVAGLVLALFTGSELLMFLLGWLSALLNGWWIGTFLRARRMLLIAAATVVGAASKFAWALTDSSDSSFYHAVVQSALASCLCLLFFHRSEKKPEAVTQTPMSSVILISSMSLAFFAAWAPQMDLLVTPRLLSDSDLGMMAKVALLTKAFFFGFQILAQILLSHQVQKGSDGLKPLHYLLLASSGMVASLAGTVLSFLLGWPTLWAALSLLHVTTLCLLYLVVQDLSSRHQGPSAIAICLSILSLAGALAFSGWPVEWYWLTALLIEGTAVILLVGQISKKQKFTAA